jgi:hypothetical protein
MISNIFQIMNRFTSVFTGEFDTPEVIWSGNLRKQVVDMINQHIGDFRLRLRQFSLGKYEYTMIIIDILNYMVFCLFVNVSNILFLNNEMLGIVPFLRFIYL